MGDFVNPQIGNRLTECLDLLKVFFFERLLILNFLFVSGNESDVANKKEQPLLIRFA